jgi:hypothetical protein
VLDEMDILYSGSAKAISTLKWTRKEDLLPWICSIIQCNANDETLEQDSLHGSALELLQ